MRPTGSKIHRVWKCPASAVLPQAYRDDSEHEPARAKGQAIHAFLENVKRVGRSVALAEAPRELLPLLEALDLDDLPVGLACEVAFAWNWRTGAARELGRSPNLPRTPDGAVDYDKLGVDWSCEIPCTLDVVGVQRVGFGDPISVTPNPVNRGYVGDYKSGHGKYPAPDMFGQTLLGALCVRSVWGCDDVVVELIHIHDNGGHHKVRRTVTDWDLDAFAAELALAMGIVGGALYAIEHGGKPAPAGALPTEGPWCEFCDAYKNCPAKLALVRSIPEKLYQLGVRPGTLPDKDGVEQYALVLTPGMLTVRNAADAWMAIELIEDALARAKQEICGIAAFEEIPLPDGRVIGFSPGQERREINGRIGAELLEKRYGRAERDLRVELSLTMAALRLAVASNLKAGEKIETKAGTGVYDRLLVELEGLGGLSTKTVGAGVKPHVPKKKRLPSG